MKCWICGNEANSGEHHIKKSDLKLLYPSASQKSPIYSRRNGVLKNKIGSIKSKSFMFDSLICKECNNAKTQDYDRAWETLSNYLHENWMKVKEKGFINLYDIFGNDYMNSMILVQLFFTKIFGCKISESSAPILLNSFSESILNKQEHPNLYISIRDSEITAKGNYSAVSDIEIYTKNEKIIYAHLFYTVGNVTVDILYCLDMNILDLNGAKVPSSMKNILNLSSLNYDQEYIDRK